MQFYVIGRNDRTCTRTEGTLPTDVYIIRYDGRDRKRRRVNDSSRAFATTHTYNRRYFIIFNRFHNAINNSVAQLRKRKFTFFPPSFVKFIVLPELLPNHVHQ